MYDFVLFLSAYLDEYVCFRIGGIHAVYSKREIYDYAKLTNIVWSFSPGVLRGSWDTDGGSQDNFQKSNNI